MKNIRWIFGSILGFLLSWQVVAQASNVIPSPYALLQSANTWNALQTHTAGVATNTLTVNSIATSGTDVQIFTSGTTNWTKPAAALKNANSATHIMCWGGGASGGARASTGTAGGGGGGAFKERWILTSKLGATESVVIPAAAAGVSSGNGTVGGDVTFGAWVTAYGGGGGGNATTSTSINGGGGGGALTAGANVAPGAGTSATRTCSTLSGGRPIEGVYNWDSVNSVNYYIPPTSQSAANVPMFGGGCSGLISEGSVFGGGAGGYTANGTPGGAGDSIYGGGGGGSSSSTAGGSRAGGASIFGGAGGAGGAYTGGNGTTGTAPGGGGGGAVQGGTSGAGALGRCEVYVF